MTQEQSIRKTSQGRKALGRLAAEFCVALEVLLLVVLEDEVPSAVHSCVFAVAHFCFQDSANEVSDVLKYKSMVWTDMTESFVGTLEPE